ncbi:MAG: PilZ domain-containing protein [Deltaproteobacteria bacterium]
MISREFERFSVNARVRFTLQGGDAKSLEGTAVNLSMGGCGIVLKESPAVDSTIQFVLSANAFSQSLTGTGKVVNVTPVNCSSEVKVGVKFTQVDRTSVIDFINASKSFLAAERKRIEAAKIRRAGQKDIGPF